MFLNDIIVSVVKVMPKPVVRFFADRYIAGDTLQDGINQVKDLNAKGIIATMDVLGESITTKEEAIEAKEECLELLEAIHEHKLDANLSIKPTQFGLMIDEEFAYQQLKEVVQKAKDINNFVRLDMEDSDTTDKIINLYKRLLEDYKNIGIVVQAYLKRTLDDVNNINKIHGHYRLCKGIYVEPEEIAFKKKQEVRDNFMAILDVMLKDGIYVGIATHDKYLVEESYKMIDQYKYSGDKYEFQMLLGVQEKLRDQIVADGHKMRIYVPFGKQWYAYSIRRLKENPNMAMQIFLNIFKRRR